MTPSKPPVVRPTRALPFDQLPWDDFERLCLMLLPHEGFQNPQHYGAAGGEQGRDIVARRDGNLWYVLCKKIKRCGPKILLNEIEKVRGLIESDPDLRPVGILFIASCDVSATARDQANKHCLELGLICEVWGRTDLDARAQKHSDIVTRFFSGQVSIEATTTYTEGGTYIEGRVDTGGDFIGRDQHIHYHTQRPPIGIPFQAPSLPAHFIPRPEVSNHLKNHLLADDAAPGTLVISAVHGLGGIGKTTLVAALAHDPNLQARFPEGVLWATLGQQPDVLSLLAGWIQALGDYNFHPTVAESASAHLRTLLHDKSCLLVVDDAWQADHVRAFLVGEERCRVLATTRDATLARKVGARLYDLDVMTEPQALALFEARLGPLDSNREQAAALARELGYLPLALELAVSQVEVGISWADLLEVFRQALADLSVLDLDEATYRNESLRLSFGLSLDGLPPDGRGGLSPDDRQAFVWMGVLPEDVRINRAMAATLWDQPEADAHRRLRRLRDKALLKPIGDDLYTIHDLLHDEAKLRLVERMPLLEAHAALLARYRQKVPDGRWDKLPNDGYIHEHLVWHMEQAEQIEAIHALLRLETEEERNAWYEVREVLGQTAGYLDDIRRVWRLAEEEFATCNSPLAIGLQCRYALITASFNSLARSLPPALIVALVKERVWTHHQGLAYACHVPDAGLRTTALVGLATHLPEPLRGSSLQEALSAVREIEDESDRAKALAELVPRLAELGYPQEALAAAQEIRIEWQRAETLNRLAAYLPEPLRGNGLQVTLAVAQETESKKDRAKASARLVSWLTELGYPQEALTAARQIEYNSLRLAELGYPQEALAAAQEIRFEWQQAETLVGLAPYLPEPLLREALATARKIWDYGARAEALAGLAPRLAELGYPQEALAAVQGIEVSSAQAKALVVLAPHLPELLLQKALAAAREIRNESEQAKVLAGLAPHLPGALLQETLVAALALLEENQAGESPRAEALAGLAPHLSELLLKEALAAAQEIRNEWFRAKALAGLALHLPESLLQKALVATREIVDGSSRAEALAGLVSRLAELGYSYEALAAAREIRDHRRRTETLARLALRLTELDHPQEALAAAQEIWDVSSRTEVLVSLAPHLPEALKGDALQGVLAASRGIGLERIHWVEALAKLVPYLPGPLLQEALATVREVCDEKDRAEVLARLALQLAEPSYIKGALAAAREIRESSDREKALAWLAPRLTELGCPQEALEAARRIRGNSARAEALVELVPNLSEPLRGESLKEALAAAQGIWAESDRAEALAGLAPHLPEPLREKPLKEALAAASLPDTFMTG